MILPLHNNCFTKSLYARICVLSFLLVVIKPGNTTATTDRQLPAKDSTFILLQRLDLTKPGLEKVKTAANDPDLATKELLNYYRERTSVKHPVDRTLKKSYLGNYANAGTMETADNAMKHIFLGQPAYPPYFCGDDIDWGYHPPISDYYQWVVQLNRMYFWTSMAQAYWHTGDEKYAKEWVSQLCDWVKKVPRDKEHDYAWLSLNAGIRGYQWSYLFMYFLDSPAFTPEFLVTFLNSCHQHADYLMGTYTAKSNWALMEAEGMAFIAILFPEFKDAEKWKTTAADRLNMEIDNQVYSDGHQRELAMGYHLGCINWFCRTLDLAVMNGMNDLFPESYQKKIELMCEVPMKLGLPDGSNTQFGDSWKGNPGANWGILKQWATRCNRPDFLYVATEGAEGEKPGETAFAYKESGLYSMRSGWNKDAICFIMKCGPDGGWHCEPDNGTFELYAGGRHLMPDGSGYIYNAEPENRAWFRQTKVHQTITLNGENSLYAPKHLLWQTGENLDVLVVENESYPNLTHRRAVFFVDKSCFVIVDEVYGEGAGDVDLHFQFAPGDIKFDNQKMIAQTSFNDGWNVLVQNVLPKEVKMEEEEGQISFVYAQKEPRPAFRYRVPKKVDETGIRFVTIVVPFSNKAPEIKAEIMGNPEICSNKVDLKISVNGIYKQIGYNLSENLRTL